MPLNVVPFLTARPWPVHPSPMEDETLISWMHRLAIANGLTFHGLCAETWEGKKVAGLLLDRDAPAWVLETLSHLAVQPRERVFALTLLALEGRLFTGSTRGRVRWVIPNAMGSVASGGQQFCPQCLAEDKIPHFRLSWRLAFVATCMRHHRTLMSACPACNQPITLNKWVSPGATILDDRSITACRHCGFDLRTCPDEKQENSALPRHVAKLGMALQNRMLQGLGDGWMAVEGHGFIQSHLVLDGIHQILKLIGAKRSGERLAMVIQRKLRIKEPDFLVASWPKGHSYEFLPASVRERMLAIAAWLLKEWPSRFVRTCKEAGVWSNHIQQDRHEATPFWLAKVANEQLKILHAEWRDPGQRREDRDVESYSRLGKLVLSPRLRHRADKIRFIREHPEWDSDLKAMAVAMQQAGFYSPGSSLYSIQLNLPKLIAAAKEPVSFEHTHGLPLAVETVGIPYHHPRGRAFMSIEEEMRVKKALLERQAEGVPITIKGVMAYLKKINGPVYSPGSIYRFLQRIGLKTEGVCPKTPGRITA